MRFFITVSVLILCKLLPAQQKVSADTLLYYERAAFLLHDEELAQNFILKKISHYLQLGQIDETLQQEILRIKPKYIREQKRKSDFLWNAALVSYLNGETNQAASYQRQYTDMSGDTSTINLFFCALINKFNDSLVFVNSVKTLNERDTTFANLGRFIKLARYEKKHLGLYKLSSAIIPGLGTALNGNVLGGFVSLAVCAASAYGILSLVQSSLFVNATTWGGAVGLKFYGGNIRLTEKTFYLSERRKKKQLAEDCELLVKELMKKYPITLRV